MLNFAMKPHLIYTAEDAVKTKLGQRQYDQELNLEYMFVQASEDIASPSGKALVIDPTDWTAAQSAITPNYNAPVGICPTNPRPTELGGSTYAEMEDISDEDIFMVCIYGNMPINVANGAVGDSALRTTTTPGRLASANASNSRPIFGVSIYTTAAAAGNSDGFVYYPRVVTNV